MSAMNDFMMGGVPPTGGGMELLSAYASKSGAKHEGSRRGNFAQGFTASRLAASGVAKTAAGSGIEELAILAV